MLVAAGQVGHLLLHTGGFDLHFGYILADLALFRSRVHKAQTAAPVQGGQRAVFAHGFVQHQALAPAVVRYIAHAAPDAAPNAAAFQLQAVCGNAALRKGHVAKDGARRVALALALQAAQAHDFARAHAEAYVAQPAGNAQVFHAEQRIAKGDIAALGVDILQHAAHHHGDDLVLGNFPGGARANNLSVLEHGDAVGQLENLVQTVGDIDDSHALPAQAAHDIKQARYLAVVQGGGGLVQDKDAGLGQQRAGDFHTLLFGQVQAAHLRVGVELIAQALVYAQNFLAHGRAVQRAVPALFTREEHVFQHREVGKQVGLLVHKPNAQLKRFHGAGNAHTLAFQLDHAAVGLEIAAQHVHQRGFTRAVFAHKRVYLALFEVEIHAVQRLHARELLGNSAHFQI